MEKRIYWYIDDDPLNQTIGANLKGENLDVVFHEKEKSWEEQLKVIISNVSEFDGLLLDWQLQGSDEAENTSYDAEALAQQIRRLVSERKIKKGFPIILCSAAPDYDKIFSKDLTGHDLFDLAYNKSEFSESEVKTIIIRDRFCSLADDYPKLSTEKSATQLLGLEAEDGLDNNVKLFIESKLEDGIPHEIARIIIDEVLSRDGLLVKENLLAVRLGVDHEKSGEEWDNLLNKLSPCKYSGVFHLGWSRWWMSKILNWWKMNFPEQSLRRTPPSEKVEYLNHEFDLDLVPLELKEKKHTSELLWIICSVSNIPIDTKDGLVLAGQENLYPWQEKNYVSIASAIDPNEDAPKVAAYELARLTELKASISGN